MVKFVHVSSWNTVITKDTFKKPKLNTGFCNTHSFNLSGALYLSKVDDDNSDSSMWVRACQILNAHTDYYIKKNNGKPDEWLAGTKTFLDLDFDLHCIYLVDNPDDLKQVFIKYGKFSQSPIWETRKETLETHKMNEQRFEKLKELRVLNQFIDSQNSDYLA